MRYKIARVSSLSAPDANWNRSEWQLAETLQITHFPWEDSGHHPTTEGRMLCSDTHLAVIFRVQDQYVRAIAQRFQDSVCSDSCVEFFVAPLPGSLAYFNFEINCGGTMLLYRNPSVEEHAAGEIRVPVEETDSVLITIAHSLPKIVEPELVDPIVWTVEYQIPFTLFEKYFGSVRSSSGAVWRGNFYKCADRTSHPHWGSWAPVETTRPNFHIPKCFQAIEFE